MVESQTFFTKMVDELVEFSEHDPELSDGLKWLDGEAQKKGLSFYDMVYQVLYKHDVNSKAKEWLNSCLLYTSPSPRDVEESRMPSSA